MSDKNTERQIAVAIFFSTFVCMENRTDGNCSEQNDNRIVYLKGIFFLFF